MKYKPDRCPECGQEPAYILERLLGLAMLEPDDQGGYDYTGDTEVLWDEQDTIIDFKGRVALQCSKYHEWEAFYLASPER